MILSESVHCFPALVDVLAILALAYSGSSVIKNWGTQCKSFCGRGGGGNKIETLRERNHRRINTTCSIGQEKNSELLTTIKDTF